MSASSTIRTVLAAGRHRGSALASVELPEKGHAVPSPAPEKSRSVAPSASVPVFLGLSNTTKCLTAASALLTPKQAAEYLGIPETTLAQWRSQRRGPPFIKLELRLVRYRMVDLQTYLSERIVHI